jgi:hypothetical protein
MSQRARLLAEGAALKRDVSAPVAMRSISAWNLSRPRSIRAAARCCKSTLTKQRRTCSLRRPRSFSKELTRLLDKTARAS